jgi:hypothetical protein
MTDQHPVTPPQRLADAALAALGGRLEYGGGRLEYGNFRTISAVEIDVIHDALERLKQLEAYLG